METDLNKAISLPEQVPTHSAALSFFLKAEIHTLMFRFRRGLREDDKERSKFWSSAKTLAVKFT